MASQRQRQIIELLQSHKTGLSGNDLSNFLGVSSRTIRTDIKALEGELQAYGAAIHANTRNGYSLEITDEALFAAFIGEAAQGRMDSSENRVDAIIRSFFLSTLQNASLTQQQLADSLYVSLSTLKSDMKEAKERLAEYGLTIGTYRQKACASKGKKSIFETSSPSITSYNEVTLVRWTIFNASFRISTFPSSSTSSSVSAIRISCT